MIPPTAALPPKEWSPGPFAITVMAVIPVIGLIGELMTGALSDVLSLFPTWTHVVLLALAVAGNVALYVDCWRAPRRQLLRVLLYSFVVGVTMLYALVELPAVPLMLMMSIFGLGVLAMSPYLAGIGLLRMFGDIERGWLDSGRTSGSLFLVVAVIASLPLLGSIVHDRIVDARKAEVLELAELLSGAGDEARELELAASLREVAIEDLRSLCVFEQHDLLHRRSGPHLASGEPFWFLRGENERGLQSAAKVAIEFAHGHAWDAGVFELPEIGWRGGTRLSWRTSAVTARTTKDAALAHVDWLLEVDSTSSWRQEARFEFALPVGAVASQLSLWIDDEERPAAFGGSDVVEEAYRSVVRRARDPALLQEVGPRRVRLLLFPVTSSTPMRARVGFTVPMAWRGDEAWLALPTVAEHNCGGSCDPLTTLRVDDAAAEQVATDAMGGVVRMPRGSRTASARDADGVVVQRMVPREPRDAWLRSPCVVVLEASRSVAQAGVEVEELLRAFPDGHECVLYVVHGRATERWQGTFGSDELAEFVSRQRLIGGVDARRALRRAAAEAKRLGAPRVFWLHGAMPGVAVDFDGPPLEGVQVAAMALHPDRNALREGVAGAFVDVAPAAQDAHGLRIGLAEFVRFGADAVGEFRREFERVAAAPEDAVMVDDQLARLWAATEARSLWGDGRYVEARRLARRFRLVTAGVAAVVLERKEQYDEHGLDPGAAIGREPDGPVGQPVPEPSTLLLFGTGLLLLVIWRKRRTEPGSTSPLSSHPRRAPREC